MRSLTQLPHLPSPQLDCTRRLAVGGAESRRPPFASKSQEKKLKLVQTQRFERVVIYCSWVPSFVASRHTRRHGRVVTPGWCQIGYTDRTGCHQPVLVTIRPTRVVTPGCQFGYVEHTGCHQLMFWFERKNNVVKSANPTPRPVSRRVP